MPHSAASECAERTYYDCSNQQQLPLMQMQFSIHKEAVQIVFYAIINQQLDFDLIKQAVNEEIARNDSLRVRLEKRGKKLQQYFLPEYKLVNIPVLDFTGRTKEEQDSVLSKDARTPLKSMKGEMYRVILYRTYDGRTGIYLNISHIISDLYAVVLLFSDLLDVIAALRNGTPMPRPLGSYEECLKRDLLAANDKEKTEKDRQFFADLFAKDGPPIYVGVDGMRMINRMRRKKRDPNVRYAPFNPFFNDRSENIGMHLSAERAAPILAFCEKNAIPLQTMVYAGMRTYLSKINNGEQDVTFTAVYNCRMTVADKRTGGCCISAMPLRTILPKETTFMQALEQTQQFQFQIFRHADYPLEVAGNRPLLEKRPVFSMVDSMLLSCLPFSFALPEGWQCEVGNYSNGRFTMPLYTVVVPNFIEGGLDFHFERQVKVLRPDELEALFEQSVKVMEAGAANPGITLDELMNKTL